MQHGVGRASQGDNHDHRIFEGLARHDVARLDVAFEQVQHGFARPMALVDLSRIFGGDRAAVRQTHAQGFDSRSHRISRVHSTAGTSTRTGVAHDLFAFFIADLTR
jgi:hypothetical protein